MELTERFDPVKFSLEECEFLLEHLGQSPTTALEVIPKTVAKASVQPEIERVYELLERDKTSRKLPWIGLEAIKDAVRMYLNQSKKWENDFVRSRGRAPRFPSLCTFDSKGRAYLGGVGSDSGMVKTYFDANGNRVAFAIDVMLDDYVEWKPEWIAGTDQLSGDLKEDAVNNRVECKVCGHTETFRPESHSSVNAAKARMRKHLKTDKNNLNVAAHREALMELGG